jgi:hypothetical protein
LDSLFLITFALLTFAEVEDEVEDEVEVEVDMEAEAEAVEANEAIEVAILFY